MEGEAQGEGSRGLARGGGVVPWQGKDSDGGNLVGGSLKKRANHGNCACTAYDNIEFTNGGTSYVMWSGELINVRRAQSRTALDAIIVGRWRGGRDS